MASSSSPLLVTITKQKLALATALGLSSAKEQNQQSDNGTLKPEPEEREILPPKTTDCRKSSRARLNENKQMFDECIKHNSCREYLKSSGLFTPDKVSCESEQDMSAVNSPEAIVAKWCNPEYDEWLKQCLEQGNDKTLMAALSDISADLEVISHSNMKTASKIQDCEELIHRIQLAMSEEDMNDLERCSEIAADMASLQKLMKALVRLPSITDEKLLWELGRERREQNKKLLNESIKRNQNLQQLSTKASSRSK